ncbi:MAG TPA: hypothetical protein VIY68_13655 [Steroidobacteraceae bacterium]
MKTQMLVLCVALAALSACHKSPPQAAGSANGKSADAAPASESKDKDKEKDKDAGEGVSLTPEQIEKIGLQTTALKTVDYAEETAGYGTVIPHEAIAQAVAELRTAQAAEKQSGAALARTQRLSGTPGAMSADVEEANARQVAVDTAALNLAQQRLSASFGQKPPWSDGQNSSLLQALADGRQQLVRVTFPLGALPGETPKTLSASRLGAGESGKRWKLTPIWSAPADATVPGRSFFSILRAGDLGEGERIIAWAPIGAPQPGVLVPTEAAVISDGKYWCYLEAKPGTFVRTEIDTGKPFENGYVVAHGVKAGDKVVTRGASQLLAQESGSGADAD